MIGAKEMIVRPLFSRRIFMRLGAVACGNVHRYVGRSNRLLIEAVVIGAPETITRPVTGPRPDGPLPAATFKWLAPLVEQLIDTSDVRTVC